MLAVALRCVDVDSDRRNPACRCQKRLGTRGVDIERSRRLCAVRDVRASERVLRQRWTRLLAPRRSHGTLAPFLGVLVWSNWALPRLLTF